MWSISQVCRCTLSLRATQSKLLVTTRNGLNTFPGVTRQLITPARCNYGKVNNLKGFQLNNLFKSNAIIIRFCSSAPKPKSTKAVGYWLLGCSGMVFTAVVLGMLAGYLILLYTIYYIVNLLLKTTNGSGVTRLTESGLSMVTWKLLGEKLPTSEIEWEKEFEKYQQYPEFKYKNQHITLSEFKWIWYMEYAHRTWGRAIGGAVFLPAAFFWARGFLDRGMKIRVGAYCALVAAQGLMGWYMVKSGLEDRFQGPADVPRVSQYRLAAHLSLAFVLYAGLLGGALRVLRPSAATATVAAAALQQIGRLRGVTALAHTVKAMVFLTAVSGAFVAGLDAGLVYNSFPKMGDRWIPREALELEPRARNFTENPATVQLQHRVLATATLLAAVGLAVATRGRPLSPAARRLAMAVAAAACVQAGLGVATLLHYVPTGLAASHQAGSLLVLSLAVWLTHEVKLLKYIPK